MIYTEQIFDGLEYLMSFPNNYDNTKKYPLLIYLHGAGTRNTNYEWLKRPVIYNTLDEHGLEFIVVAPLCRKEAWFDHFETLIRFVDYISRHENVDPSRVYLTGCSMGGYATWQLAMSIPEYFEKFGEKEFRAVESEVIKELGVQNNLVIATGGGAVMNSDNVKRLKHNSRVYFLNRDLSLIVPTGDRPLSSNYADLEKRYKERYGIYSSSCDLCVDGNGTKWEVAEQIIEDYKK